MDILLLCGDIQVLDVEIALLTDGIVVLETTRIGARHIEQQVRDRLFADGDFSSHEEDEEDEDSGVLVHLSTDVHVVHDGCPQLAWTDYLVYTKVFKQKLDRAKHFVRRAVAAWAASGGTQGRFVYRIR